MSEIWAIINVTPDSFFASSRAVTQADIVKACSLALRDGADVLDIGAYSTRPGHSPVDEATEFARLSSAMTIIKREFPTAKLSIDTFRSNIVQRIYADFGAFIVNDIQGGILDKQMYAVVANLGLDYVMMSSENSIENLERFFATQIPAARAAGVTGEIIVDPGFGFGKSLDENFLILKQLSQLRHFGRILAGISRKRMVWQPTASTPADALAGTCALNWQALVGAADILRVHDVAPASQIATLYASYKSSNITI